MSYETPPSEVVAAAGHWLGQHLAADGFAWSPGRLRLQRAVGSLTHQVHLQSYRTNRAGGPITFGTMLNVRDSALRTWRRAHPDLVAPRADDFVCGHLLGYASGRANGYLYGDATDGDVDLTDPDQREQHLTAFVAMFREAVLPWFDEASDPELIWKSRAGDYTNSPVALVEWLASRGRTDLIQPYVQRHLARTPPATPW